MVCLWQPLFLQLKLHCPKIPLPSDAVVHLARLPSLRTAGIALEPGATLEELDEPLFPTATYLHISLDDLAGRTYRKFISNVAATSLGIPSVTFRQEPSYNVLHLFISQLASSQNALKLHT